MPKLDPKASALRVRRIEDAALKLFKERGFHGVGMREIAREAGVSLGNIYNYFDSKEPIFHSIFQRLFADFVAPEQPLARKVLNSQFPDDLEQLGQAIGEMVDKHRDYFILTNIDIAEFNGKHSRPHYSNLAQLFEILLKTRFDKLREQGRLPRGVSPALAFMMVYMQFFNYFVIERLIGAKEHMGLPEEQVIREMSTLFRNGLNTTSKVKKKPREIVKRKGNS